MKNKKGISSITIIILIIVAIIIAGTTIVISKNSKSQNEDYGNIDNSSNSENIIARNNSDDFLMTIEDVFYIEGRGTVVTGSVKRGSIKVGEEIEIVGLSDKNKKTVVNDIEMLRESLESAEVGDNVGIALRGIKRTEIERGQVLAKVDSIKSYSKFDAIINIQDKDDKGKKIEIDEENIDIYFRTITVAGSVKLKNGVEMTPNKDIEVSVTLPKSIAMEVGNEFDIIKNDKKIGKCKVIKVYE